MKTLRIFTILTLALASLASCGDKKSSLPHAQGTPYEMVVVASHETWDSQLGDSLRAILQENIPAFNSAEPLYTLQRILPQNFNGLITKHRNIIIVNVSEKYEAPKMLAQYDTYASAQLIVRIVGPDIQSVTDYISDHRDELVSVFEITERDRDIDLNTRYADKILSKKITDMFGFKLSLGKGFILHDRNKLPDSVMWISREYPFSSQGMVIYSYPYTGREDFSVESLLKRRDEFVKLLPGENENSHMVTVSEYIPILTHKRINGRYWAEMRGFWEVYNDFMGGPFVSYSTLDTETNRVVTLDFYVYSPDYNYPRRNYYRQLQHLIYGVSFPGDNQKAQQTEEAEAIE